MPLFELVVYLMSKNDNLRLTKLIDEEYKYMMSVENRHIYILIVGFKVSIVTCQPDFFGLKSATLILKKSF